MGKMGKEYKILIVEALRKQNLVDKIAQKWVKFTHFYPKLSKQKNTILIVEALRKQNLTSNYPNYPFYPYFESLIKKNITERRK